MWTWFATAWTYAILAVPILLLPAVLERRELPVLRAATWAGASRGRLDARSWVPPTGVGMGLGLLLGAVTVGYGTSLGDLALMGVLTGLVLGPAQALALPRSARLRWGWAAAMPALWALGWTATTLGTIAVDEQFTVFGAYGAITFSALSGLLLLLLLPERPGAGSPATPSTPVEASA